MLTKVIATGAGALIAGVAAYQITNTYMGDCGSSCSDHGAKTAEVVAVAETGDSCCPLTGSKGAEILAVAETEACAEPCATECTDEQKAACAAKSDCSTDSPAVVLASSTEASSCSTAEKAACSAEKAACGSDESGTVEILMVAGEEACSTEKAACDSAKTECETKAACETEQLAKADAPAGNG
jgi:hypothetical protein